MNYIKWFKQFDKDQWIKSMGHHIEEISPWISKTLLSAIHNWTSHRFQNVQIKQISDTFIETQIQHLSLPTHSTETLTFSDLSYLVESTIKLFWERHIEVQQIQIKECHSKFFQSLPYGCSARFGFSTTELENYLYQWRRRQQFLMDTTIGIYLPSGILGSQFEIQAEIAKPLALPWSRQLHGK